MAKHTNKRACVVVLGDVGRSPRMQYHALSLAKNGFNVDVIGYGGSKVHNDLAKSESINCLYMKSVPNFGKFFPRILVYILKTLWQSFFLLTALLSIPRPQVMLVQNPPSIPTLPVCWLACKMRHCKLIIDFHNYGYTILGLSIGRVNLLVKICEWYERIFGQKADLNLCVSKAMQRDLAEKWNVRAVVFYDSPPGIFHPVSLQEKHALFKKLANDYEEFGGSDGAGSTKFSKTNGREVVLLENRPVLVVSSTSWTEDEDFYILLAALIEYDQAATEEDLPNLFVAITGKGPLKAMYETLIKEERLEHVQITTMWLAAENYPTFLASCDLGVCLHMSSSGLDLPMKVVDMFGSGIPVCAVSYPCIDELVKVGENGVLFSSSSELANHFQNLLKGFPSKAKTLEKFKKNISKSPMPKWDHKWNKCVLPFIHELISR